MIQTSHLIDMLRNEMRHYANGVKFQDDQDLTLDAKLARLLDKSPIPNDDQISYIIEDVFWASLLAEEGRPCRPRLLYKPDRDNQGMDHVFVKAIPLRRETLRKLTPAQGPLGYVVWNCNSGTHEIVGIWPRYGGDRFELVVAASSSGAIDINWSCARLIALRAGRIDLLSNTSLPDVHAALDIIRTVTGNEFEPVLLARVIRTIYDIGHGGAIWILPVGRSAEGIQIGYGLALNDYSFPIRYEQRTSWLRSYGYLAATDGAVLLNAKLKALGFGAFIDVPDKPKRVVSHSHGNMTKVVNSTDLGGGRHRSGIEFCTRFAPAAAVVVSEDGRISLMWADANRTPHFSPLSLLGVLTDTIID